MKNKFQIAFACILLTASACLLQTNSNSMQPEVKINIRPLAYNETSEFEALYDFEGSEKTKRTLGIVQAFSNYSDKRMKSAIVQTYDDTILDEKNPDEILTDISDHISKLKGAHLKKLVSESPNEVTLKMEKNEDIYFLEIHFHERTQKIKNINVSKIS